MPVPLHSEEDINRKEEDSREIEPRVKVWENVEEEENKKDDEEDLEEDLEANFLVGNYRMPYQPDMGVIR